MDAVRCRSCSNQLTSQESTAYMSYCENCWADQHRNEGTVRAPSVLQLYGTANQLPSKKSRSANKRMAED